MMRNGSVILAGAIIAAYLVSGSGALAGSLDGGKTGPSVTGPGGPSAWVYRPNPLVNGPHVTPNPSISVNTGGGWRGGGGFVGGGFIGGGYTGGYGGFTFGSSVISTSNYVTPAVYGGSYGYSQPSYYEDDAYMEAAPVIYTMPPQAAYEVYDDSYMGYERPYYPTMRRSYRRQGYVYQTPRRAYVRSYHAVRPVIRKAYRPALRPVYYAPRLAYRPVKRIHRPVYYAPRPAYRTRAVSYAPRVYRARSAVYAPRPVYRTPQVRYVPRTECRTVYRPVVQYRTPRCRY